MSTQDISGPVFPCPEAGKAHFSDAAVYMGLTVRQYAAIQFSAAILANPAHHEYLHSHNERNEIAFKAADAWLKASSA